jgi:hypothetical protein
MFLDGPHGNAREALRVIFSGRKVRPEYPLPAPELHESVSAAGAFVVFDLEALVRMKLTGFRHKDIVHLQDLISVGLIDASWMTRFASPLRERLQQVLENPDA